MPWVRHFICSVLHFISMQIDSNIRRHELLSHRQICRGELLFFCCFFFFVVVFFAYMQIYSRVQMWSCAPYAIFFTFGAKAETKYKFQFSYVQILLTCKSGHVNEN